MNSNLAQDQQQIKRILEKTLDEAKQFLADLPDRPVGVTPTDIALLSLPDEGIGAEETLDLFKTRYMQNISGSAGPRYFGLVTGGSTPAALAGDWLTSTFDQNAVLFDSAAATVEVESINMLRQLFGLPDSFSGTFVTGATMSNFASLALARQWVAHQQNVNIAISGLWGLKPIKVLSGAPHSTIYKALAMLGMGKNSVQMIPVMPAREAIDLAELACALQALDGEPCIVVANAGTVNTVDFDDIAAIAELKSKYKFWLHVDGAFGGFAACSPQYRHLVNGVEHADSMTIDAHKWLNVPYDSAMQFTRHRDLQLEVFQMGGAAYLGQMADPPDFVHLTPESSRRFRALPAWFTLMAYGRQGYQEIVERNCALAVLLGEKIDASDMFRLVAPTRMNVVCFTLNLTEAQLSTDTVSIFLARLRDDGRVFMTPTTYKGTPAIRAAISNWQTQVTDIEIAWQALQDVV